MAFANSNFEIESKGNIMSQLNNKMYTLDNVDEAIRLIKEDKYVILDVLASFRAINETILDKESLKKFVINAKAIFPAMEYSPLNYNQIKDFCMKEFITLKSIESKTGDVANNFDMYDLKKIFDRCEIYAHKNAYRIKEPSFKIFINNAANPFDYRLAKEAIKNVVNSFENTLNNENQLTTTISNVQLRVRGLSKFIDIKISGIDTKVLVGFDFR